MNERWGSVEIRAYCICGGALNARSDPPEAAEAAHTVFQQIHSGEGHRPCDARTARRARHKRRARLVPEA